MYEKERELAQMSIQSWTSKEVFSFGWFLMFGILVVLYAVWLKLVDRKRGTELILIGSLEAIAKLIVDIILGSLLGLYIYKIRLLPLDPNILGTSVTLCPVIVMLVQQYTSSWKGYILWTAIGNMFLSFAIFPLYTLVGVLEFHNWNVFYQYLVIETLSLGVRVIFLWITGTQKRLTQSA